MMVKQPDEIADEQMDSAQVEIEERIEEEEASVAEPEAEVESEPEAEIAAEPEAEVEAEPEDETEDETEVEVEPEADGEVEIEAEVAVEVEPEPEPEVGAEADPVVEPAPEPEPEPAPEPEPEPEPVKKTTGLDRKNIVQKGTEVADPRVRERFDDVKRSHVTAALSPSLELVFGEQHYEDIEGAPTLLLISGSPRKHTCVSLIDLIERGARDSGVNTKRFLLCDRKINPCVSCNGCIETGRCAFEDSPEDDYKELKELIDSADGLAIIAPVYFSGPTAQLKALYDRFQPYWVDKYIRTGIFPEYRPGQLYVVGSGGDPHGFDPLVTISKSCLQIAGFSLEKIYNFVGYLEPGDAPKPISEEELPELSKPEIATRKKSIIRQNEFRTLALEAGQAFGRLLKINAEKR